MFKETFKGQTFHCAKCENELAGIKVSIKHTCGKEDTHKQHNPFDLGIPETEGYKTINANTDTKQQEEIEAYRNKKQELKDWLYGTVYKGYDQEEEAEIVQQNVDDFFTEEWFSSLLLSNEAKVRKECGEEIRGMKITTMVGIGLDEDEKVFNQALESAASAITNKQN